MVNEQSRIILVGCGRMGLALLGGWLEKGIEPKAICVIEPFPSSELRSIEEAFGVRVNAPLDPVSNQVVFLAVKPQQLGTLSDSVGHLVQPDTLLISIMAGKTVDDLRSIFPGCQSVIRAMPNLAASVGEGATVAFADSNYDESLHSRAGQLLEAVGLLEWLPSEHLIDVATGLSGSGPAYVFYFADCLTQAGIAAGLEAGTAERLARATISGAGLLLKTSSKSATELRSDVTSPAGTTEAGLKVLLSRGKFQNIVCATVASASVRARELSKARLSGVPSAGGHKG